MVDAHMIVAERRPLFAGHQTTAPTVSITVAPPALRLSLRAPAESVQSLSKALGLELPVKPKSSASNGSRHALWLGPDEWLIIDDAGADLVALLTSVTEFHSTVDVSHRNVGFVVTGPGAATIINAGCPQDLSLAAFPVGAASRTILHKIEIVLYRTDENTFRVECWRSFADYAFSYLSEAARDAAV
ncbi:sarcosine oxidase subunit gamma [Aliihoeflea sp. PC F10.4]